MKKIRLYDMIFPFWLLILMPPLVFITLAANFVIDSVVVIICYYAYQLKSRENLKLSFFYRKSIIKVWLLGFLADIFGVIFFFIATEILQIFMLPVSFLLPKLISNTMFMNIFNVVLCIAAMLASSVVIFLFNYFLTFRKIISDRSSKFKLALTIAIVTIPWTFLIQKTYH